MKPLLLTSLLLAATGCIRTEELKPLPAPEKSWPLVAPPVAEEGSAQVLIDTDVPARVDLDDGRTLCDFTPCAFPAEYGEYRLVFHGLKDSERTSTFTMHVAKKTVVLNHVLGVEHRPAFKQEFGFMVTTVGLLAIVFAGIIGTDENATPEVRQDMLYLAAGGTGVTFLGGLISLAAPTVKREGSSTQWSPVAPVTPGVSFNVKF